MIRRKDAGAAAKFGTATKVANELIGRTTNTLAMQHNQQQQQQQQHKQQRSRCLTLHNLPNEERDRATQPSSAVVSYNFTMKGKGKKGKVTGKGKKGKKGKVNKQMKGKGMGKGKGQNDSLSPNGSMESP